jgi:hypothetical protein
VPVLLRTTSIWLLVIPVHTSRRLTLRQRAALALAVAVLACAALLGIADYPVFASPRESAGGMMKVSGLGVRQPSADLRIRPVGVRGTGGRVTYTFRVSNAGPDTVTFEVATTTYARPIGTDQDIPHDGSSEYTLSGGQHVDVPVTCESDHICAGAVAWIDRLNGIDPNSSNNLAYVRAQG